MNWSVGPRSVQYHFSPENDGPSAKPTTGTVTAALISPPSPSVTPVRKRPRDTAARALAGSTYAPAAPAAASCPVWLPEGSATRLHPPPKELTPAFCCCSRTGVNVGTDSTKSCRISHSDCCFNVTNLFYRRSRAGPAPTATSHRRRACRAGFPARPSARRPVATSSGMRATPRPLARIALSEPLARSRRCRSCRRATGSRAHGRAGRAVRELTSTSRAGSTFAPTCQRHLRVVVHVDARVDDDHALRQRQQPEAPDRVHHLARVAGERLADRDDAAVVEGAGERQVVVDELGQRRADRRAGRCARSPCRATRPRPAAAPTTIDG